jgi:hypothetical protein
MNTQLRQSQIDTFLTQFKQECDRFGATLKVVSSCNVGSHYRSNQITLDREQIQDFIESSNGDPLEVWRVVGYHELAHHQGYFTEESCWNSLERRADLDQDIVSCIRTQVTIGRIASAKGRNWDRVKNSINSEPIQQFIQLNQLSANVKELIDLQTPGKCWHFVKTKYQQSLNLEKIITPLLPDSKGYLLELCHSQKYDFIETEVGGLLLWRQIQPLL